ncbi:MAG: glycosyltransferase [Magnetococcus sp. YQC-5]
MNKKILLLRSHDLYNTGVYFAKGFHELGVDLIDIQFDPHKPVFPSKFPQADLLLIVDSGLPVIVPGHETYAGMVGYLSIDSAHKLQIHKTYINQCDFDLIWVAQKHVVGEFGDKGRWLPVAADAEMHAFRPQMAANESRWRRWLTPNAFDIGMCAAPYPHRYRFETLFKRAGLSVHFVYRKKFGTDATRELARGTIGFNVGAGFDGKKGKDINMRVFETMANGQAMLLTNTYEGLGYETLFEEGVHFVGFRTEAEAVEKAVHYARHPEEAIRIARVGQQHILNHHTYRHRCQTILDALSS